MHITLIKPRIGRQVDSAYIDEGRMEPLSLAVLGGLTPRRHSLALWDDRFESIPFDKPTDLAAITVETFTARRSYEIAAEYRRRGVPVVMGGMHATLLPEEVAEHADSVCIGDAESCWADLLVDAERGTLKSVYAGTGGPAQDHTVPRRELYAGKRYLPVNLIQFSRGCPHACLYCATASYFKSSHHVRSTAEVVEEIGDGKLLFFVDDNFTASREAAKELLKQLIPLKVHWVSQINLDAAEDTELLALMKQSGCLGFVAGFESIRSRSIEWMNKQRSNRGVESAYRDQIGRMKDYGFQVWAAFTLGHDFDTISSIEDTVDFALRNRFTFAAFNILLPYPGTPLYLNFAAEDRLLFDGKWWLHPDYRFNHAAFVPKNMSPEALTAAGMAARKRFNSVPSILRRALDLRTNMRSLPRLLYYARYSLLFRKEVRKKEGMLFGEDP